MQARNRSHFAAKRTLVRGRVAFRTGGVRLTALLAMLILVLWEGLATAQCGSYCDIKIDPPIPGPNDPFTFILTGTWCDSCVPRSPVVSVSGRTITISTSNLSPVCLHVLTDWELKVFIGGLPVPGWYQVLVIHNGQYICGKEFEVREGLQPPVGPFGILAIPGTTDGEGKFSVPLPIPGVMASGRLLDPSGGPLANQAFSLTPVTKGATLSSPEDITAFVLNAPGYGKTFVTKFSRFTLFGLTSFLLGDVKLEPAELPWNADRPITWDDFQGDPPEDPGEEAAQIFMELGYSFECSLTFDRGTGKWKAHLTKVTTTNTMDRSKSWVVPDQKTPELLNHEQKHFDLNEVYRRLLDAELQKLVCKLEATGNTKEEAEEKLGRMLNEVFDKFNKKCGEVQEQYDKETDHGRNAEKQREWDKKISDWLSDPSKAPQP